MAIEKTMDGFPWHIFDKPKPKPKKQESPEVLKKLETSDKQDAVYTAYNHVYGINM